MYDRVIIEFDLDELYERKVKYHQSFIALLSNLFPGHRQIFPAYFRKNCTGFATLLQKL